MEELDLKELFEIFWHKKVQIILLILIFMMIGVIYTIGFVTPMYTSSTTLVLVGTESTSNTENQVTESITTTDITINSKLVSTYSELVKSKSILGEVISNLGIDIDEEELRKNIEVTSVEDTNNVYIVDQAEVESEPSNVNHVKDVAIFAFIGVVVAVMYVLIANMLDTTVKTQEDIEKMIKIPVLACIPVYDMEMEKLKKKGGRR